VCDNAAATASWAGVEFGVYLGRAQVVWQRSSLLHGRACSGVFVFFALSMACIKKVS